MDGAYTLSQYERLLLKSQSGGRFSDYDASALQSLEGKLIAAVNDVDALRAKLAHVREKISDTRDLLRTGTAPMGTWVMSPDSWEAHKCNKAAAELSKLIEELEK